MALCLDQTGIGGQKTLRFIPPGAPSHHSQTTSVTGLCSALAESDVEIVWWKFRVVKTHCHLFLMSFPRSSNAFSLLTLCEENEERGGDSQPGGFRSRMGASLRLHQCA